EEEDGDSAAQEIQHGAPRANLPTPCPGLPAAGATGAVSFYGALPGHEDAAAQPSPRGAAPRRLYLLSEERPDCMGEYRLVQGATAGGQPLWKSSSADRWVYSAPSSSSPDAGTWMVGGPAEFEQGFQCKTGYLHLRHRHGGESPDKVAARGGATWSRWCGSSWVRNADVELVDATRGFTAVKEALEARLGGIEASRRDARAEHAALDDEVRELRAAAAAREARRERAQE
ncbi:unnamed protein product, partial [Prorocentrum cordatum]